MTAIGAMLALQGMGYVDGAVHEVERWATIGSIIAGLGVALGIVVLQHRRD